MSLPEPVASQLVLQANGWCLAPALLCCWLRSTTERAPLARWHSIELLKLVGRQQAYMAGLPA